MDFLRITAANGTQTLIPLAQTLQAVLSVMEVTPSIDLASGRLVWGRITDLKYLDGAAAAAPTITVLSSIPLWDGSNNLYEIITLSSRGAALVHVDNRVSSIEIVITSVTWDGGVPWDSSTNWS